MELNPDDLTTAERYKLLVGAIVPRPIALVSTLSQEGYLNLAPFSFFNGVGSNPMLLMFCPANNADGSEKHSLQNAAPTADGGTGQFVVNIATESFATQMAAAAEPLPHGQSEFDLAGLTPAPSCSVRPPRVAESPIAFECTTLHVMRFNPGTPAGANMIIGQVVHIHADDKLINDRMHIDPAALNAIGRMSGLDYCTTHDRFQIPPGKKALQP